MFPSLMRPKPPRRIAQDTFFHQAGILFGNPVLRSLFGSLGHQFHIYGIVAAFHLLRVEEYDRQIQFAGKAFGAGQDGGILVQEVRPVVQVVPARCLVGDKDHDTAGFVFLQGDDIAHGVLFCDPEGTEFRTQVKKQAIECLVVEGSVYLVDAGILETGSRAGKPFPVAVMSHQEDKTGVPFLHQRVYQFGIFQESPAL